MVFGLSALMFSVAMYQFWTGFVLNLVVAAWITNPIALQTAESEIHTRAGLG